MSIKRKIKRFFGSVPRNERVMSYIDKSGLGLEIGPSFNPIAPKRDGFNVEIVDHLSAEGLKAKYKNGNVDTIEEVDYVWKGESLAELVGKQHCYDWIIASHVIEHTPDLVGFINSCEEVLKENGVLFLAVPDARYCFDYFRPLTGLARVVDAHLNKHTKHSVGTAVESLLCCVSNDGRNNWSKRTPSRAFKFGDNLDQAIQEISNFDGSENGEYKDYHSWCFTPSSFRMLIHDLHELKLISLAESDFSPTIRHEFFIVLKKNAISDSFDRTELALKIKKEIANETSIFYKVLRVISKISS